VTSRARLAAALALALGCGRTAPFGPTLVVEDVVRHLDDALGAAPPDTIDPGDALRGDGARAATVLAPGTTVRLSIAVPERAALRFGVAVAGDKTRDDSRSGLRFTVRVGDAVRFERTINPAADRHDRRWFDERIDLGAAAGTTVDVTLAVDAEAPARPPAGVAAWSRVRLVQSTPVARQRASADRPNVLVLLVDTLRADAVGLYGAPADATPALDALGARGTVFATAVSQSSWTLPSVATLMTGLAPRQHRAVGEPERAGGRGRARWGHLADAVTTWAELAAHAGITTFAASANPLVSGGTNLAQGFETFVELPWDPEGRDWPSANDVNDAFRAWLPRRDDYRFAAYLHYMEPHDPYTPEAAPPAPPGVRPQIARGWVRDAADRINWSGAPPLEPADVAHLRARYAGEVAAWDRALAGLVRTLDEAGLSRDTVIVVTADHGEEFQEHGRLTHGSQLYEESVRVPLVLAGPGVPAARRDDVAQGIDVAPTLARLLGAAAPTALPGRDLLGPPADAPAFLETASGIAPDGSPVEVLAVRTARWKLIETPAVARRLYDLASDPGERTDLGAAEASAALVAALDRWRAAMVGVASTAPADPSFASKLRALGYAQ
jgi:arylsulfatase A-like enzyme